MLLQVVKPLHPLCCSGSSCSDTLLAPPDLAIGLQSNVGSLFAEDKFLRGARMAADQRARDGYDADGRPGGPYTSRSPPPGLAFGGYLKGCTGITWVPEALRRLVLRRLHAIDVDSEGGPGFCDRCGFTLSLFRRDLPRHRHSPIQSGHGHHLRVCGRRWVT